MTGAAMAAPLQPGAGASAPAALRSRAKNAWLWGADGEALSDVKLTLRPLPSAKGENAEELAAKAAEPTAEDCEYHLHSVVLAANSLLFRHRLLHAVKAPSAPAASSDNTPSNLNSTDAAASMGMLRVHVIEERVAPNEVSAAQAVLQHMYTEELLWDTPSKLVQLLKIADKWKAEDTIDACRRAFAQLRPEDIDLDVIKRVYCLEGIVNDVANFAELMAAVQSRLVQMFQDVVEVARNPAVQAQFLQLPFAAVLALLRSEQLIVDSENSVVVAANLWVMRGRGRFTSADQRRYLAGAVRLSALTPSYLCGVLPNLRWFSWPTTNPALFYSTLQARLVSPEAKQVLVSNMRPSSTAGPTPASSGFSSSSSSSSASSSGASSPVGPATPALSAGAAALSGGPAQLQQVSGPGVMASGSTMVSHSSNSSSMVGEPAKRVVREQNLELVCDIEFARLSQYLTDGCAALKAHPRGYKGIHVHSECSFFRGYLWGIKVVFGFSTGQASAEGASPPFTVTPSVFASLPPGEEGMLPLLTPVTVSFRCTLEAVGPYGTAYASASFPGASFMRPGDDNVSSIGISNFWKKITAQQDPESWKPFLVNNKLRLKLTVQGVHVE